MSGFKVSVTTQAGETVVVEGLDWGAAHQVEVAMGLVASGLGAKRVNRREKGSMSGLLLGKPPTFTGEVWRLEGRDIVITFETEGEKT